MTVYKYFIKIALKNKGIIFAYTIIFFIITAINGSTSIQREEAFTATRLDIGIVDNSESELSKALVDYLGRENNIIDIEADEKNIKEQVFLGIVDAAVVIQEDIEDRVINKEESIEIYKDDRNVGSYQVGNQINKFFTFANATYENGHYDLSNVNIALEEGVDVRLIDSGADKVNQNANIWFKFYFNFSAYVITALFIAVIGFVMTDFTDKNIDNRMKISSIKFLKLNKEIYLGQLTIAGLVTLIFILGAIVLRGSYISEVNFLKYIINLGIFSLSILCLTFLINNLTSDRFIITGLSTVLSLGTSFISGVMVPQEFLGEKVLTIAKFFPTYYYIKINEMNVTSFLDMRNEILMQLLFAIAFLSMGLYFSKAKQKV